MLFVQGANSEGRVFYNEDMSGFNFDRQSTSLTQTLSQFESGQMDGTCYIGSTPVDQFFPGMREHNDIPLPFADALVSIWMGNRSRIAAHFDTPDNVACCVAGRRRFTLFPPEQIENLYVGPLDFTPAGQAISLVDFKAPDFARFPRFREALRHATVAELEPGDALFVPSMWWHHVESLDAFNVLINYWWHRSGEPAGNPLQALVHALMSVRDLPEEQREAWRKLFQHYVFDFSADAVEHIPANRRGVLGTLDRSTLRQLRAMLRNALGG